MNTTATTASTIGTIAEAITKASDRTRSINRRSLILTARWPLPSSMRVGLRLRLRWNDW